MKKRVLLVIVLALISVWCIHRSMVPTYATVLESNWNMQLPGKARCKEVYAQDAGPSFHGDGVRYHVFSCGDASTVEKMLPWSDSNGNTLAWSQIPGEEKQYQTYSEAADLWLGELGIPQEQYPDYGACLCWYEHARDNSEIVIFWNPEINRLYIVENFI